ncbi:alpha/beta fold hydrolase [Nocardia cyriacigeorgica]|uniref:alpha/beta fold hydrolase n=1 Tax=Nocardia cyriacigeorgica TaxID=135487 RepID=UPI0018935682|nr:alpha/beta fold hydrolase [Nocardia cyriacigeorgica]MBF6439439.1 alpha/beta fold hydrolase [Nocardia cyriacigeorgica]
MGTGRSVRTGPFVVPEIDEIPGGRLLELPGRGRTYVVDLPGPPDAPTLILLHGTACTAMLNWFPALETLSRRYRIVLFDQRWHGRGIRSQRFRLDDCADDVVAVADALGLERFVCVGYSLGGVVSLLTAHRHPERVAGLVLCATPYRFQDKWRERAFHRSFAAMAGALGDYPYRRAERLAEALPELPVALIPGQLRRWAMGEFRSTSGWALTPILAEIGRFDATEWLSSLRMPTAVVITTKDRAIPVYRQIDMAAAIPGASIHPVPAGHTACAFAADRFVPVLDKACAAVAARL